MPTHTGPKKLGEKNLVFGYDLSDRKNSYLGEPTTNLATDTPIRDGWPGSFTLIDTTTKTFDYTTTSVPWGGGAAWSMFYYNVSDYIGQYVTISAFVESFNQTEGTFSFLMIGQTVGEQTYLGYSPAEDRNDKNTTTKERISWSGIIGSGGKVGIVIWMNNSSGNPGSLTVRFSNVQVEVKSHPTPFVNGTRSTTQGLLDVTRNSTINLTNVSFDSNAKIIFDGTNDYVSLGNSNQFNLTNSVSIFAWVKINNLNSVFNGLFGTYDGSGFIHFQLYGGGLNCYLYGPDIGYDRNDASNCFISVNTWSEVGMTFGVNTLTMYINGVEMPTKLNGSGGNISNTSDVSIGRVYDGSRYFDGNIDSLRVYNRTLTQTEISNNYNNTKRKYGI
jgi:hypothetical protein